MASSFLDNLKNAVEKGEFNSEAAKKILEVEKLADEKLKNNNSNDLAEPLSKRLEEAGVKTVSEEEAAAVNSEYEKKMEAIKKEDEQNKKKAELANQVSTLDEIEDMVKASIEDMMSFVDELDTKFAKEFEAEDPLFGELCQKIEQIKSKYNSIINN